MTLEEKLISDVPVRVRLQRILNAYLKDLSMDLDQDHGLSNEDYEYLKSKTESLSKEMILERSSGSCEANNKLGE